MSNNKELFRIAIGLEIESFECLFEYLNPGEDCCNIRYHERLYNQNESTDKTGPKPKLPPIEQLFLYLTWLKNGFTITDYSIYLKRQYQDI